MAVNNEAKPRRATKADILEKGSGKMFTYEHLEGKRLKRAEESAAQEARAKARRDRKSKNTKEAVEATTSAGTAKRGRKRRVEVNTADGEADQVMPKRKVARVSNVQVVEGTGVAWVAPLAKMY
jgi:hypothetical protein